MNKLRRQLSVGLPALLALPAMASSRRALAAMTDGPFYPPRAWRERWADQDADLTRVQAGTQVAKQAAQQVAQQAPVARGEHLGLQATVVDTDGRLIDGAEVEIWQCDTLQAYRHPGVPATPGSFDPGFQGFGATRSDGLGVARLRTIKPVPYPGRTPHIHVKLRHASFGELTSQLFIADEAANARDFLWRQVPAADRGALEMRLQAADAGSGLRWQVRHQLIVPA